MLGFMRFYTVLTCEPRVSLRFTHNLGEKPDWRKTNKQKSDELSDEIEETAWVCGLDY